MYVYVFMYVRTYYKIHVFLYENMLCYIESDPI